MTANLRAGVVGVGYLGKFHARIYSDMPDVDLVGVVDSNAAVAQAIGGQYGAASYTDYRDLLDKVDVVSIVVPTSLHREVTLPFIEAGVHVLLEKPVASTLEDAQAIVDAADRRGVSLQIGHLERYNAGIMALHEQVIEPRFIEAHRLSTFVERATDVDVVVDLMIHDIDIIMSLVGEEIGAISATGLAVLTDHIDIANARLEFVNGAVANVTASRVSTKKMRRIRMFGRDSYQALDFEDQQLEVVRAVRSDPDSHFPEVVKEKIEVEPVMPLDAELADFIRTVRAGTRPLVNGADGCRALDVAFQVKEKIMQSLA